MAHEKKKKRPNSILRLVFVGISILVQAGWLILLAVKLNDYSAWISAFTSILSLTVVLKLNSRHTNSAFKTPWIMLILAFPVMGLCLYLLFEKAGTPRFVTRRIQKVRGDMEGKLVQREEDFAALEARDRTAANQCRYLRDQVGSPVYAGTQVRYYGEAKYAFEDLKEAVSKAERFIFLEYFIIEDGSSFEELREILVRKAAEGVDVRLMYDDIGSIGYVNLKFALKLNEQGIKCQAFNMALPMLNLFLNHRDHRKIAVIDGKVGFTGGYNLADEYFDRAHPYGQWKDTGLRLEGQAVRSLTATFLELWFANAGKMEDMEPYLDVDYSVRAEGYVQPFADDPLGEERVAENVYLNLVSQAEDYVWFMTPYLIITDEMSRALTLAAKRGVDVRIITPGIPDKKMVYQLTRSYYAGLVAEGVRIYEFTPGFVHAKQCLCDGRLATVGTSNLDYRSLYLHFENDVLLYGCDAVGDIRMDFENTFAKCEEVTEKYRSGRSAALRLGQYILRLFAPLM